MSESTMSRTVALARPTSPDRASSVKVTVTAGPDAALVVARPLPCVIGRSENADVRLTDPTASAMHLEITAEMEGVGVRDLGSANGTMCGGVWIGAARVPFGSHVQIGATMVRLDAGDDVAPSQAIEEFGGLRSASASMRSFFGLLGRVAPSNLAIVIESTSLAEADHVARSIHDASGRAGPFVVVDCAVLTEALADGILPLEGNVTAYLRSVSDLAPRFQTRFLDVATSVRFVSSTTSDLAAMLNRGTFHEDLWDRIAQIRARVPSLDDRKEDIPAHVYAFLQGLPPDVEAARAISKEALQQLRRREWPGGLRELREVVERAAMVASGTIIAPEDLLFERMLERARTVDVDTPFKDAKRTVIDGFEREYLAALLARCGNNVSRASSVSGVERHHLRDLLRKHGLRGKDGDR